jgi:hypothetical protein
VSLRVLRLQWSLLKTFLNFPTQSLLEGFHHRNALAVPAQVECMKIMVKGRGQLGYLLARTMAALNIQF